LTRLFVPALAVLCLCSCIGVESQILLNRDGSGTLLLSYRVSQFFREDPGLPLPVSGEEFQRVVQAAPGLRLAALSQRQDEQDLYIAARIAFDRVESLNVLGNRLELSNTPEGSIFRQRLYPGQPAGGIPAESLGMIETFFSGYVLSFELSSPAPIRSYASGQLSEDGRSLRYQTTIAELLKQKDEVTLEVIW
jgi:hypothetical protein